MVPAGNKAKRLSSVSHTTKTIQFNSEHVFDGWVTSLTEIMRSVVALDYFGNFKGI